jgi:putative restriction endonuclease
MRYWWVNQNQTYRHEVRGGFLWSPKHNKDGRRNQFYDNMISVETGDLIFSFCDTRIKAVGIAQGEAVSANKPEFGNVGDQWGDDGWYVPVEFEEIVQSVRPKDFIDDLRPHLSEKYAPLQANGNGNQVVYLAEISEEFALIILGRMGLTLEQFTKADLIAESTDATDAAQAAIEGRTSIGATQKQQLVLARRGQGIFRANVRLNEKGCRITGITDQRFLRASHIKPWRLSDDREKLDGCNGLLLSPHIDHLFDKGYISFDDNETILKSLQLPAAVWNQWGLADKTYFGSFNETQKAYLAFHRTYIWKA